MPLKKILFFVSIALVVLMSACSATPPPIAKPSKPEPKAPPAFIAPAGDIEFRGTLILYKGQGRFQTCSGDSLYWFNNGSTIGDIYNSMVRKAGEAVYIEFTGNLSKVPAEYADEFNAQANVLKLHHMANVRDSLACNKKRDSEVSAFGLYNEWQAKITNERITLKSDNESWTRVVRSSQVKVGGKRTWRASSPNGNLVEFGVKEQPCRSKNNHAYWSYTSQYFAGTESKGCADISTVNTQTDFLGHYSGTLPIDGKKVELNLSLNADYSVDAAFVYSQNNDPIEQNGFWQPISNTQVLVSLVKKGDSQYSNQFLFDWDTEKLSTKIQGFMGIARPIKGKGLEMWLMDSAYTKGAIAIEQRNFIPKSISYEKKHNSQVQKALLNYFTIHRTAPNGMQYNYNLFDLNGDGKKELLIQLNWCSNKGCTLLIFENMGKQYRFVSRTTDVHNSLLLATGINHQWQQLLARQGSEYVRLEYDGIGYPISTKNQPIAPRPLPLANITLFAAPEPVKWHHALPK